MTTIITPIQGRCHLIYKGEKAGMALDVTQDVGISDDCPYMLLFFIVCSSMYLGVI